MSGGPLISDHAIDDFAQFPADVSAPAADLARSGRAFAVLHDNGGHPVRLLTGEGPAPLIQVNAGAPMDRMTQDDVKSLVDGGAPAFVVVDQDDHCVGILTAGTVINYLMAHVAVQTGDMSDAPWDIGLGGNPAESALTMTCGTCDAVNKVPYYVEGQTMCTNGHPLKVTWD